MEAQNIGFVTSTCIDFRININNRKVTIDGTSQKCQKSNQGMWITL